MSSVFLPPTVVFGLVEFCFTVCVLLSSGQGGGEEGEATGGASATLGLLVLVLDLLFVLVLVLIEVLVEVLLFKLVLDAVLVEVGEGAAWIELPGLLLLVGGRETMTG